VGATASVLCLIYFSIAATRVWRGAHLTVIAQMLPSLMRASVPLLLGYATAALGWLALLRWLGCRVPATSGAGIFLSTQFAKYLPGNVGHYIGRVGLAVQRGYRGSTVALSMVVELGILLAIGAAFSLPLLNVGVQRLQQAWGGASFARVGLIAVLALLMLLAAVGWRFRSRLLEGARTWAAELRTALQNGSSLRWLGLAAALAVVGFCLSGLSLVTLAEPDAGVGSPNALLVVSLFSVAWGVGLLTPGLPAGLGIRDAILVQGLTPLVGEAQAVWSASLFRVLTTLADAIAFAIGLLLLKVGPEAIRSEPQDHQVT